MFTDDAGTSVSLPVGPNGVTTLTFADGSFDAGYSDGDVFIGDQIVPDVPDAIGSDGDGGGDGEIFNITATPVADVVEVAGDLVFKRERPAGEATEAVTLSVATTGGPRTEGQGSPPGARAEQVWGRERGGQYGY